jgi:hypothetical protein
MDVQSDIRHHERQPGAGGHLTRARSRAGVAASKVADRIWGPAIDRHLHDADRNGFTGRDYAEAAERVALREDAARRDPLAALAYATGTLTVDGRAVA